MSEKIHRRDDATPADGENQYGDVAFADPVNKKYPIDTPEHVRAAWGYINREANTAKYEAAEVEAIKDRIRRVATRHGVHISTD